MVSDGLSFERYPNLSRALTGGLAGALIGGRLKVQADVFSRRV